MRATEADKPYPAGRECSPGKRSRCKKMRLTNTQLPKKHSPETIRSEVERLYDFTSFELPGLMSGGTESAGWQFKTDEGPWIAKVFAPYEGLFKRIAEELQLYDYLSKQGINVPRVLTSKRLQRMEIIRIGMYGYPIVVMKCEDLRHTRPASIQKAELLKIAQTVARMHQCLKLYPMREKPMIRDKTTFGKVVISLKKIFWKTAGKYRPLSTNSRCDNFMIRGDSTGYDVLAVSPIAGTFSPEHLSRIQALDRQMKAYLASHSPLSCITKSLLHGDLSLEHAPFLPNGDVYLYDFADYAWGAVAEDLAKLLERMYAVDDITFDRWEELKDWLLKGYDAASHLTPEDLEAILPFMMRALLVRITFRCNISRKPYGEVDSRCIERRYRLADYLLGSYGSRIGQ